LGTHLRLLNRLISRRLPWWKRIPEPPKVPRADLWPKVHEILVNQLNVPRDSITPQAHLVDDLGLDSLDAVELVMAVEEEFGFEIPDEDAEKLTTIPELLRYLEERLTHGTTNPTSR